MLQSVIATVLIAQAVSPVPSTGNDKIDTAIYMLTGLLGLREGTHWFDRLRKKKSNGSSDKLEQVHSAVLKSLDVQEATVGTLKDVVATVDKMQGELQHMRVQLAEMRGRMSA